MVPSIAENATESSNHAPGQTHGLGISDSQARGTTSPPEQEAEVLPASVEDFDAMIESVVKTFVNVSEEIGGLVAEQVGICISKAGGNRPNPSLRSQQPSFELLRRRGNSWSSQRKLRGRTFSQRFTWRF